MDVRDEWIAKVSTLKVGRSGGAPAVHKPLLTLMLLARAQRRLPRVVPYLEIRQQLSDLIVRFGSGKRADPRLPFWHLQSEGFWEVLEADALEKAKGTGQPRPKTGAMDAGVGRVPERLWNALTNDGDLALELGALVLQKFWAPHDHEAVARAVGLDPKPASTTPTER